MGAEYKRFLPEHVSYTQKSLLQGQLESLMSLKHLHAYKALRNEELIHKIKLKTLLEHARQEIDVLLKNLPQPAEKEEEVIPGSSQVPVQRDHKTDSLEAELDAIRAKLARLK